MGTGDFLKTTKTVFFSEISEKFTAMYTFFFHASRFPHQFSIVAGTYNFFCETKKIFYNFYKSYKLINNFFFSTLLDFRINLVS